MAGLLHFQIVSITGGASTFQVSFEAPYSLDFSHEQYNRGGQNTFQVGFEALSSLDFSYGRYNRVGVGVAMHDTEGTARGEAPNACNIAVISPKYRHRTA